MVVLWLLVGLLNLQRVFDTTGFFHRGAYKASFRWMNPSMDIWTMSASSSGTTKPMIILAGPHGILLESVVISFARTNPTIRRSVLLAGDRLFASGLFGTGVLAKMVGFDGLVPLVDADIRRTMTVGVDDILVCPGGIIEGTTGHSTRATLYDGTWAYWVRKAMTHGYDLTFVWVYGGTQMIRQSPMAMTTRERLVRWGIPTILPYAIDTSVDLVGISTRIELPHVMSATAADATPYAHKMKMEIIPRLFRENPGHITRHAPISSL